MILMERDKNILRFVEEYGSITITQCSRIFFKHCKENYYQARKRLKKLADNKYLNRYRKDARSETIYYLQKKLSIHDLKALDVYAYLIYKGADITFFKREYIIPVGEKNYRCDALIEFTYKDYFYTILVEVDYTHFTSNKKIEDIYNSMHFQRKYRAFGEDIFPRVLIIRPVVQNAHKSHAEGKFLYLDFTLQGIEQVFE